MQRIKTFTQAIEIFKTAHELDDLDERVNRFLAKNNIKKVISVSDSTTTDNTGATIGLIRVLAYED